MDVCWFCCDEGIQDSKGSEEETVAELRCCMDRDASFTLMDPHMSTFITIISELEQKRHS